MLGHSDDEYARESGSDEQVGVVARKETSQQAQMCAQPSGVHGVRGGATAAHPVGGAVAQSAVTTTLTARCCAALPNSS
ncbi:hypothetical protein GCM10009767_07840 [Kocuria aegyptia]|uniref:Uncharacterized protein n=1 Tax=Kocuria aegyptia TaxID=330943 RepID=A0ABP4WIT8_9MICC